MKSKLPFLKDKKISQVIRTQRAKLAKKGKKHYLGKFFFSIAALIGIALLIGFILIATLIPDINDLDLGKIVAAQSTIIYDREGNVLYTIHGEENRKEIPLSEIPKHVIDATVSIEDDQFFEHYGFDIGGIVKAVLAEYFGIGSRRGGSTITQQLVKNTLLTNERSVIRKLKELILSIQAERTFSKNEILAMYLNTIPYGNNAYGIEMASRVYFDKPTSELTVVEASILASLPQAPSRYNPYGNGKELLMGSFDDEGNYVAGRKDVVLKRMEDLGYITQEQRQDALAEGAEIKFKKYRENITHPHLVLYVKELLENKFGKEAVETGGLHVYTTIDPKLQQSAEDIITEKVADYPEKYGATNAGLLSVDLEKGHILAMVGSADYFNEEIDGNVNMVFRQRLPGSSFKPIVYAAGFLKGYSPATVLYDLETDFGNDYIPQNYDGSFSGPATVRRSLARSLNIPAVKMAYLAGVDNVVKLAKNMGLSDLIDADQYGTSIGLGTGEATMYQMVTAYSVLAKGGKKISFTPFLRIETANGKIIESNEDRTPTSKTVLDPQVAYSINHILSDKDARPAGWEKLSIPDQINAAKTGTSNKRIKEGKGDGSIKPLDNWTIGYTTKVATAVWVGNNDSTPLNYNAAGLTTAGPIWNEFMQVATEDHDLEEFEKPDGITWERVSRRSGLLPSENTPDDDIIAELFTTNNFPTEEDNTLVSMKIDKVSGKLPTEYTPESSIITALIANFHSQKPTDPNWEEPVQRWAKSYLDSFEGETIILAEAPTETDDIHTGLTAEQKPSIEITSPGSQANVRSGPLEIQVQIDAPQGVEKVEFFLDQNLVDTTTTYPYTGKIRLRRQLGETHRIGVTVTDTYYYTDSDIINVTVSDEQDNENPRTQIIYPEQGAIFPPNTTLNIQTNSSDNISVAEVIFFFDDRELGRVQQPPYEYSLTLPEEIANHQIRVFTKDTSGNTAEDDTTISIQEDEGEGRARTQFIFPKPNSVFKKEATSIDFFFQVNSSDRKRAEEIAIVAINELTQAETSIYSVDPRETESENYSFSWIPTSSGGFEFQIHTISRAGNVKKSSPLRLTIE